MCRRAKEAGGRKRAGKEKGVPQSAHYTPLPSRKIVSRVKMLKYEIPGAGIPE